MLLPLLVDRYPYAPGKFIPQKIIKGKSEAKTKAFLTIHPDVQKRTDFAQRSEALSRRIVKA